MDLKSYLNQFLFGYYPYLCLAVFFLGSLIRFDREQYTWTSDSSQLLRHGQLRWGSNLVHIGILGIFFGHLGGCSRRSRCGTCLACRRARSR